MREGFPVKSGFVEMKASIAGYAVNPKKDLMTITLIAARSIENLTALTRAGEFVTLTGVQADLEEAISPAPEAPDSQGALPLGDGNQEAPSKGRKGKRS